MTLVLLTGMTSSQASSAANVRNKSYAQAIHDGLVLYGHTVVWADPSMRLSNSALNDYDAVVVGLAPITSLAANRTYGALDIIERMWNDDRLSLFIDAPHPGQIFSSLRAIARKPENLVKSFYSYRPFYTEASDPSNHTRLMRAVELLLGEDWPTTLYPALPWDERDIVNDLPEGAATGLTGFNLDSILFQKSNPAQIEHNISYWVTDNVKSKWLEKAIPNLLYTVYPMKVNKGVTDETVAHNIRYSVGSLITPQKGGDTWWTYRYVQSLEEGIPIATEWRDSHRLGPAWDVLPAAIEHMPFKDRGELALFQRQQYESAIQHKSQAIENLSAELGLV